MNKFTDVQFLTAKEKQLILKQWITFLKFLASPSWQEFNDHNSGSNYGMIAPKQFTDRLYKHLSLHCGFIAHFNIHGFYSTYFDGDPINLKNFFDRFEKTEYGGYNPSSTWGDYQDIGKAMADEYLKVKNQIFIKADERTDDKFELLKECVKRAETDLTFRKQLINKLI